MKEIVKVSSLRFGYPDGTFLHFRGLDFVVHEGERVAILGPNGSGKSTLLYLLIGILKASEGVIQMLGVDPSESFEKVRDKVGVLLQDVDQQIIAPTVWDDVSFSPRNYGYDRKETKMLVESALDKLDISHLKDKVPHYLSGGEKIKVGLAGAIVTKPDLLILDEPFEGIDPTCRTDLVNLLNMKNREHRTSILMSTHNMDTVPLVADTVYLISEGGEIVGKGTPEEIFSRVELLRECHVEPPVLGALFTELRKCGIDISTSLSVEDAARKLAEKLETAKDKKSIAQ